MARPKEFSAPILAVTALREGEFRSTAVQQAIERIRSLEARDVKIIVGGPAFESVPELWRKVGADGYSASVEDTEPLASRLTRS